MTDIEQLPTVLYIACESRSGSTLLDQLLGSSEGGISVGEMRQLRGYALNSYEMCGFKGREYPLVCTCGEYLETCAFWSAVEKRSGLNFKQTTFKSIAGVSVRRLVQVTYLLFGVVGLRLLGRISPAVKKELIIGENCFRVYNSIGVVADKKYIIDSSKAIYQYILLRATCPKRVKLILLYRDGRAVSYSMSRGARAARVWNGPRESWFLQAVQHWVKTNKVIRSFARKTPSSDKVEVRYEDICRDPIFGINKIEVSLGVNTGKRDETLQKHGKHNIGGSPSRFDLERSVVRCDDKWKKLLNPSELEQFREVAGSLNDKLGYR